MLCCVRGQLKKFGDRTLQLDFILNETIPKFLLNIPELVYHEERVLGHIKKLYLVLENIEISKKCKPSPPFLVQVRIELLGYYNIQ